jgi:autotransporter passenger strand-loop-strand repeat protein
VWSGGVQNVSSGGAASGTAVNNGGSEFVFSGGTATSTTISTGGTVCVSSGGTAQTITFAGAATLDLASPLGLSGTISGWQVNDTIDFVSTSITSANISGATLTVTTSGGGAFNYLLAGQQIDTQATRQSDGSGGTVVELVAEYTNPTPPPHTTADMILRDSNNGDYEIYNIGNNAVLAMYPLGQVGLEWQVAGVGGFSSGGTGDTTDMMLRNSTTGAFEILDISGNNITNSLPIALGVVGLEWRVEGFGDFSGNPGKTDMLTRATSGPTAGDFTVYDISHNAITSAAAMGAAGLEWTVEGFGDFSGNPGETDMLMRAKRSKRRRLRGLRRQP